MDIGYIRVSGVDQNTARQESAFDGLNLNKVFEDKASGKDVHRPALERCLEVVRDGDTLHVHSIDRLARNMQDLLSLLSDLTGRGVSVKFHKENLTFTPDKENPFQRLQLQLIGSVAEFERAMIRERQREGIAIAKAAGKYKGRKPSLTPEQAAELRKRVEENGEKVARLAREYGVSRQTVYEHLKRTGGVGHSEDT